MEYDVRRGNGRLSRRNINGLRPQMSVNEIDFDTIYVNAISLSDDTRVFGYIRAWKNGKVGYSVLDDAMDKPDLSECGMFWMRPEDFVKVFKIFGRRTDNGININNESCLGAEKESCVEMESGFGTEARGSHEMEGSDVTSIAGSDANDATGSDVTSIAGSDANEAAGSGVNMDSIVEFREKVKKGIMKVLSDRADRLTLDDTEVVKINDQKLYGIVFRDNKRRSLCPVFGLNDYYENYIHGKSFDTIVMELSAGYACAESEYLTKIINKLNELEKMDSDDYLRILDKYDGLDPDEMLDKIYVNEIMGLDGTEDLSKGYENMSLEDIKGRLAVKVLARDRNREFLKTVPHKDIDFGFSVVFDVQNVVGGNDVWRMPVTGDVMKKAGVSEDQLYDIAMENVNEVDPAVLVSAERAASGRKTKNLLENDKHVHDSKTMYVLTNRCGRYGAAALFYPGMQKKIADKLEDSYFAIPSSLHEFIIVPESSGADMERLRETLRNDNSVNQNQEDVFCNEILHYDRKWGELACVTDMIGGDDREC